MKKDKPNNINKADIRRKAEELSMNKNTDTKKLSLADTQSLVHELEVHQIALEMQNEELRRIRNELEISQSKYADLYDFAPISYFTFDKNGLILEVNLTGAKKLGRERANLVKTHFSQYIQGNKDLFYLHLREVFSTGNQITCELRLAGLDGNLFDAQMDSLPVHDSNGNLLARTVMRDITDHKFDEQKIVGQLEMLCILYEGAHALTKITSVLEMAGIVQNILGKFSGVSLIWLGLTEPDGNIRQIAQHPEDNKYLRKVKIRWDETLLGQGPTGRAIRSGMPVICTDVVTDPQCCPWKEASIAEGFCTTAAFPLIAREKVIGTLNLYSNQAGFFSDKAIVKFFQTFANHVAMTIRNMQFLEEASNHALKLEQRVTERTAELNINKKDLLDNQQALLNLLEDLNRTTLELEKANIHLKEIDITKSMFIASISHELRTPLNSIIGFSSILLNEWIGPVNDEQKKQLDMILKSGTHLLALINDVIDVSKIEAGAIDIQYTDFDLYDLLTDAVKLFEKEVKDSMLEFKADIIHQPMLSDKRRLLQCVMNLLSNAIKFTESGVVKIETKSTDNWTEISVEDTGIGIKEEDLPKLFKSFIRLKSSTKKVVPGTGLGLYLTKKLVTEALKGEISVCSKYGKGSRFVIRIPV